MRIILVLHTIFSVLLPCITFSQFNSGDFDNVKDSFISKEKRVYDMNWEEGHNDCEYNNELFERVIKGEKGNFLSKQEVNKLMLKKLVVFNLKDIDQSKTFIETKLKTGIHVFYNLEEDVEEDTNILLFYFKNSTKVYQVYIHNYDYSFKDDFYFSFFDYKYFKNGGCKMFYYKVNLRVNSRKPNFTVLKKYEGICAG